MQASFASSSAGAGYTAWLGRIQATGMPGVSSHPPEVSFATQTGGGSGATSSSRATIKVHWQVPGDSTVHTYTSMAQLK